MHPLILGSSSPRRREILDYFSIPFQQVSPDYDEEAVPFNGNPTEYVCTLSSGKAESIRLKHPDRIILTADTIVFHNGKIYGKPKDLDDAFKSLSELVGKWHTVYTGVTVAYNDQVISQTEATQVLFNNLSPEQIRLYHDNTRWIDKSGGYAIQSCGGLIVRKIDGCYYNVMGLPVNTVHDLLLKFNIDLWNYIRNHSK